MSAAGCVNNCLCLSEELGVEDEAEWWIGVWTLTYLKACLMAVIVRLTQHCDTQPVYAEDGTIRQTQAKRRLCNTA